MADRTLLMVKPDGTARNVTGEILRRLEEAGFRLVAIRALRLRKEQAEGFYEVHRGKPFFDDLVRYMTSGMVVPMALKKQGAVRGLREFIGATDPAKAAAGSIRSDFGETIQRNSVHASDASGTAAREIAFFFAEEEMV